MTLSPRSLAGMTVHPLGVGCRPIGGRVTGAGSSAPRSELQDDDARDGLKRAVKRGAAVFDTADIYGLGHSQRLLGQALAHDRDQVCITTRVAHRGTAVHAYAPPHLRHQLEQTLENLQTGYLDVVLLDADSFGPGDCFLNDAAVTLHDLRTQRLIRAVGLVLPFGPGASGPAASARLVRVLEAVEPDVLAARYNGLSAEPSIASENLFAYAERKQIPVLVCEPLARGLLTGKYCPTPPFTPVDTSSGQHFSTEQLAAVYEGLKPLRQRYGDDPAVLARLALRFCLDKYDQAIVLAGFSTSHQLETNYTLIDEPLSEDDLSLIDDAYRRLRTRLSALGAAGAPVS
ncbi:aldo/keto reductase [Streptomyces mirabilis]|uniref:aldo/keto reductase n=1 Tax=Streptomyces mirabilis TaxID=68239 RepID=UPI0021C22B28|nr:aldo/keto reductase [Streptomyces mirabilis]MCT9107585.1 aldo/keto reductase [Streptomyces mirabilis]